MCFCVFFVTNFRVSCHPPPSFYTETHANLFHSECVFLAIPRSVLIAYGKKAINYTIPVACFLFALSILSAFGR